MAKRESKQPKAAARKSVPQQLSFPPDLHATIFRKLGLTPKQCVLLLQIWIQVLQDAREHGNDALFEWAMGLVGSVKQLGRTTDPQKVAAVLGERLDQQLSARLRSGRT